jgi:hypothetical protein
MFQVPQLPPVIKEVIAKVEDDIKDIDDICNEIVIILHTRDITDSDENLCRKFGRVRHFNPSMYNRDLSTVPTDYLFVDVRDKVTRMQISKIDVSKFKVCAYVQPWEKLDNLFDEFCKDMNIITKFPDTKVTYKAEFDDLLCERKKIRSPSSCLSFLAYLVNIWDQVRKH